MDPETSVLAAALLLCFGILMDACTAIDRDLIGDAPQSLRVSSLIALCIYAAPPLKRIDCRDHRFVTGLLLVTLALLGEHTGSLDVRSGDAVFCAIVLLLSTGVVSAGGIEASNCPQSQPSRRQTTSSFCSGLLLYVSARGLRAAYTAASNASEASLATDVYFSSPAAAMLAFGHGCGVAFAVYLGLTNEWTACSSLVSRDASMVATAMAAAAATTLLLLTATETEVPVLYGAGACTDADVCSEAFEARRFMTVNLSPVSLFVSAFAVSCLAAASSAVPQPAFVTPRSIASVAAVAASVALVVQFGRFTDKYHVELAFLAVAGGIVFISLGRHDGSILVAGGLLVDHVAVASGSIYRYASHTSLVLTSGCFLVAGASWLLEACLQQTQRSSSTACRTNEAAVTAATSLSTASFLGVSLLGGATRGSVVEGRDTPGRTGLSFLLVHVLPLFASLSLRRTALVGLSRGWRWAASATALAVALAAFLGASAEFGFAYLDAVDVAPAVAAAVSAAACLGAMAV